ncbi:hypothetical protein LTR67_009509 [Exophiala xenobiotica]
MCIKFLCCECKEAKYDYCKEYFDGRSWCYVNAKSPCSEERNSCITCKTVCGAINRLNALFQSEPWWATHGKGGEPENPAWELEAFKEAEAEMESISMAMAISVRGQGSSSSGAGPARTVLSWMVQLDLTREELEEIAAAVKEKNCAYQQQYGANIAKERTPMASPRSKPKDVRDIAEKQE